MPLSFMPDMYRAQKTAMIIDGIRLAVRLLGLLVGVMQNSIYLALALYSAAAVNLIWYIQLAKKLPPEEPSEAEKYDQ